MADPNSSNVTRLVESHVYREIRGFRGNRLAVTKGIEAGLIPEEDVPGVAEHLVALRDDLAATGVDENDAFLLRFALTVPGMQRGIVCRTGARQVNPNQLPGTRPGSSSVAASRSETRLVPPGLASTTVMRRTGRPRPGSSAGRSS